MATIMDEQDKKYPCKSIFLHQTEDLQDAFTELWCQYINQKEKEGKHIRGEKHES